MRHFLRWSAIVVGAGLVAVALFIGVVYFGPAKLKSLSLTSRSVPAGVGTGNTRPPNIFDLIADAPPLEPARFTARDLSQVFPAFQHKPFDQSGFNEVMLPFIYSDPNHLSNANEAMALDALISNDLDWSPGCYCSRHAYFVFKTDPDAMQNFLKGYDARQIASLINDWGATHAIGGELIRTADGYKGKIEIYNPAGSVVFTKQYAAAKSYWDLLGDMDVDAMTFLDAKPSQALNHYLHQPRCKHFQSVIDLGAAAFFGRQSPEEFAAYQKILEVDPDFAMVRHWYANQKHWADGGAQSWALENARALSARLVMASFDEFSASQCPDPDLAAQLPHWLDQAESMVPDSPLLLSCRLVNQCYGTRTAQEVFARALAAAAKYPNCRDLLLNLASRTSDRYLSASLLNASFLDRYIPPIAPVYQEFELAVVCDQIDRDDIAMEIMNGIRRKKTPDDLEFLLTAMCNAGRYKQAADLYAQLPWVLGVNAVRAEMAPAAAFAAFMTDRTAMLDKVLQDQQVALAARGLVDVFQMYDDCMRGKKVSIDLGNNLNEATYWKLLLATDVDYAHGTSAYHSMVNEALLQVPANRVLWIIEDNYQRRDPSPDAGAFYDYLQMFYSHDPWVTAAVADFHKRNGESKPVDFQMLLTDLQKAVRDGPQKTWDNVQWQNVATPWRAAACVHQLLKSYNFSNALQIAQLDEQYELSTKNPYRISIAEELLRKTNAALKN